MAASIATSAFFPSKPSNSINNTDSQAKPTFPSKPQIAPQSSRLKTPLKALPKESTLQNSQNAPRTFYNQLPDWSVLLAAITTVFLAAEKQWTVLDSWKPKRPDMLNDAFQFGKIVQDGLVFRQNFLIRSYEIGADKTASIETLMNQLQETALNHVKCAGLMGDGFGSTPEMSKRNLIWVVSKMQVLVDRYPSWGDIVEIDTWVGSHGKNGMRRDWYIKDYNTGQTILRATSIWAMMNKVTRKLAKIPNEVRNEIEPYFVERMAVFDEDKFLKVEGFDGNNAEKHLRKGLTPRWADLDVNQHVNNVKYIGWILESAPMEILEKHELAGLTLEFRRECGKDSVLQSLTTVHSHGPSPPWTESVHGGPGPRRTEPVRCQHALSLESGPTVVKARTAWRPKPVRDGPKKDLSVIPAEVASVGA